MNVINGSRNSSEGVFRLAPVSATATSGLQRQKRQGLRSGSVTCNCHGSHIAALLDPIVPGAMLRVHDRTRANPSCDFLHLRGEDNCQPKKTISCIVYTAPTSSCSQTMNMYPRQIDKSIQATVEESVSRFRATPITSRPIRPGPSLLPQIHQRCSSCYPCP